MKAKQPGAIAYRVTSDNLLKFFVPWFHHPLNGNNKHTYYTRLL